MVDNMEWSKIVVDNVSHIIIVCIFGAIGWSFKKMFLEPMKEINKKIKDANVKIDNHVEECDKVPKSLIMERLDNLKENVDETRVDIREIRSSLTLLHNNK